MHLRTQGKRYRKRGQKKDQRGIIPNRVDIDKRPKIVEEKTRVGDFEVDTIIGKNHQGALVTINDRKTGIVKIRKVNSKNAEQVAQAVIDALTPYKPFLHTITSDNGKEFALHAQISQHLGVEFFFAKPYHSWQRGANENLNGLIRQYFPKKTDFSTISDHQVQMVEEKLNNRPRKRFNFESPLYMFNLLTNSSKVAFVT
jgi:IS30 family transposase